MATAQQEISIGKPPTPRELREREEIIEQLVSKYGIDPERVLFLNPRKPTEAWLSADTLMSIARQTDLFKTIDEEYSDFIAPLNQVVHRATVVTKSDQIFTRSGVASMTEMHLRDGSGDEPVDPHALAGGRALRAALVAAGLDPVRPGSAIPIRAMSETKPTLTKSSNKIVNADDAASRNRHLGGIHKLAEEAGLIKTPIGGGRKDMSEYRAWLTETFGVDTAAALDQTERASAMEDLRLKIEDQQLAS